MSDLIGVEAADIPRRGEMRLPVLGSTGNLVGAQIFFVLPCPALHYEVKNAGNDDDNGDNREPVKFHINVW